ncbi:PepSY domain-containing protein [Roseicyclus persicicus]|uniref:PepSY domain-containing protein n=1 Tax=Roseicyclus persicicus TaxID=2650661 RepID=A0A7X6H2C1_9RHOB|nr:PepSY domain-containing protein [Roseibacterium persicicum]NKX45536.1 PepSY domain-containing protein [Roseibacterium persicicum]
MIRTLTAGLLALPILSGAAMAAPPPESLFLGTDLTTVRKTLESMGYRVREIGQDESGFEAEIVDGGIVYDVSVDPETGLIIFVEPDTDQDGDA